MNRDRAQSLLATHHSAVSTLLDRAKGALYATDPQREIIAKIRWEMIRTLRAYQLFKHTEIFDPICRCGPPDEAVTATILKERCINIGEAYTDHIRRWSVDVSQPEWEPYRSEAIEMVGRIEMHLATERQEILCLLSNIAWIRPA